MNRNLNFEAFIHLVGTPMALRHLEFGSEAYLAAMREYYAEAEGVPALMRDRANADFAEVADPEQVKHFADRRALPYACRMVHGFPILSYGADVNGISWSLLDHGTVRFSVQGEVRPRAAEVFCSWNGRRWLSELNFGQPVRAAQLEGLNTLLVRFGQGGLLPAHALETLRPQTPMKAEEHPNFEL